MSLTDIFTKLAIAQQTDDVDINVNTLQTPISSQNTSVTPGSTQTSVIDKTPRLSQPPRKSKQPEKNVFTFVTVYCERGEWQTLVYNTLREGLLKFVERCDLTEQETLELVSMDDDGLLYEALMMGMNSDMHICDLAHRLSGEYDIKMQKSQRLVGIVKGPDIIVTDLDEPKTCLELDYKNGEWALVPGCSVYIEDAMDDLKRKMGSDEWNELSVEDQIEAALKQSKEDVREQRGWGVVKLIPGSIYARL